jgi:hypothetical protein
MTSKRCLQRLALCLAMALVPAVCQADFIRVLSEHTTMMAAVRDEAGAIVAWQSYAGESWNQPLTSSLANYSDGRLYASAEARFDAYSPYVYSGGTGRYYWVAASLNTVMTVEAANSTDWLF